MFSCVEYLYERMCMYTFTGREEFTNLLGHEVMEMISSQISDHDDPHAGHDHKRSQSLVQISCIPDDLFESCDLNGDGKIDCADLTEAFPTIVYCLIESRTAKNGSNNVKDSDTSTHDDNETSQGTMWLASIGSTVVISFVSLIGLVLIPFQNKTFRDAMMSPLISFAVGSLIGDAILHLIPSALGLHSHSGDIDTTPTLYFCLVVLLGIVTFFILERHIEHLHGPDDHHHHHHHHHQHDVETHHQNDVETHHADTIDDSMDSGSHSFHTAEGSSESDTETRNSAGWLNLFSDIVHNFVDGVAIGAAFSDSMQTGLATSIAVFCHELPQELADFTILIHSGFTRKRALLLNFVTALVSILGAIVGTSVGQAFGSGARWLMAFTAGNFLYIALTDMVQTLHQRRGGYTTLSQSIAMLVGIFIMFGLSFLEESLYH